MSSTELCTALPMTMGGLGVPVCKDIHEAALIGGWSMACYDVQNIFTMFYAKDDTKLVPREILTDTSASQHLSDIVEAQCGLMKRSPYLRMQVQLEIIALREFQAGKTTSSAVRKLPLHTDEIAETKATRPNLLQMLGNEQDDDKVDKKFTYEMRKGNNGLDSTGPKAAAVYVNMEQQERIMTTGENGRVLARFMNDPDYDVRIDGICYKSEE